MVLSGDRAVTAKQIASEVGIDDVIAEVLPAGKVDAIRSLPVDVEDYSNAEEDIRRALAYAQQHKPDPGPTGGPAPTGTGSGSVAEPPIRASRRRTSCASPMTSAMSLSQS